MPALIATGIYAYADTDRNTEYILGAQLIYMGSWLPAGSYTRLQVVEYSATNHICIRANTAQNPENGFYWSHLSRIDPDNLTPQQQLDLEIANIGSLANQALTVAFAATNLADQALTAAWAGTAAANQALAISVSGTVLAQDAYNLASIGTNVGTAAYDLAALAYAIATGAGTIVTAEEAYNLAAIGTNTGTAAYDLAGSAFGVAQGATTTANSAFEIAVQGTDLAYTALTTAWNGTNVGQAAFDIAVIGTNQANTATTTANTALTTSWDGTNLAYTALTTAWVGTTTADQAFAIAVAGTEGLNEKVDVAGDTMTGTLTVPNIYLGGSEALISGGTVVFDFAGSAKRQVFVDGTTHVTTVNQDIGWAGTIDANVTGYFFHDTVEWPLSFDDRIRFVGNAPPTTLPANQISVVTFTVVGTTSETFVVGAYASEVV